MLKVRIADSQQAVTGATQERDFRCPYTIALPNIPLQRPATLAAERRRKGPPS
jgi:hypothetical protein